MTVRGPARLTIGTRIFLLLVGAIMATALAFVAIIRFGPPPVAAPVHMEDLLAALNGEPPGINRDRELLAERSAEKPAPRLGERRNEELEQSLKQALGQGAGAVYAYSDMPRRGPAGGGPGGPIGPFPHHRSPERMERPGGPERPDGSRPMPFVMGDFTVIRQSGADWLAVRTGPSATVARWRLVVALTIAAVALFLSLLGWWVARRIARPLRRLADAARDAKSGHRWVHRPEGASPEILAVADALAAYDARHQEHFRQQSALLAGIAHDLGTPLARLAFRLEALPDESRDAAFREIEHMRHLIADGIVMARSSVARREPVDVGLLARALAERCSTPQAPVTVDTVEGAVVLGEPTSLTRLIENLIDNAQLHGGGGRVTVSRAGHKVRIIVEDDGPGIEDARLATVCEPFVGSGSTHRPGGGNGLGLAIARSIADRHDGDIVIGNRSPHGLRVTIDLPAAPEGQGGDEPEEASGVVPA
ncbi:MAG: sensor histidine kinase [Sphingobium sp.]